MAVMNPSAGAVEAALEKVLSSAVFCNSPRLRRFLESVVRYSMAGLDDRIKEYTIGVEVFDRGRASIRVATRSCALKRSS